MLNLVLVIAGAAVGAPLRYAADRMLQALHPSRFPLGTLTVNLVASAVLGFVTGLAAGGIASEHVQLLLGTGLCATLSTYSAFSFESLRLGEEVGTATAAGYVFVSVAGGLAAAFVGVWLA